MIKKADVYVEEFLEFYKDMEMNGKVDKKAFVTIITIICERLVSEIKDIMLMRKATSNMAFTAIIKEQDLKWKAIARRLDAKKLPFNAHPDSFQVVWGQFRSNMMKHE